MNVSEMAKRIAFSKAYEFLDKNPEQNFLKLVDWLEKLEQNSFVARQLPAIRKYASNPDNNWYKLALSLWNDVDDEIRKTLFTNFMINGKVLDNRKQTEVRTQYHCNIPWALMLELNPDREADSCGESELLSFDELDSIVEQGKSLGVYLYVLTGREPLLRRSDCIALCNKNSECVFLLRTSGTAIDEECAEDFLRVKNCIPVITLDGFEKDTDSVRGSGTFRKIAAAMELLKRKKVLFGLNCLYTARNCETLGSEAFFDAAIEWGAKFAAFSTYLPTEKDADLSNMLSAEQRGQFHHQICAFRTSKPLLTVDHWNDGQFMGGCLAGGRGYCYINYKGDVEPCLHVLYSDSSIRRKTLLEAMRSPLFLAFHDRQPFHSNLLRPCPILDDPDCLREILTESGAAPTDPEHCADAAVLAERCRACAEAWKERADALWTEKNASVSK